MHYILIETDIKVDGFVIGILIARAPMQNLLGCVVCFYYLASLASQVCCDQNIFYINSP